MAPRPSSGTAGGRSNLPVRRISARGIRGGLGLGLGRFGSTTPSPRAMIAAALLLLLTVAPPRHTWVHASSSSSYSAYNYDLTTPRFTPDGRLLQVEYAGVAPEGSFPILALPVLLLDGGEGEGEDGGVGGGVCCGGEGAVVIATMVGGGGPPPPLNNENEQGSKVEGGGGDGSDNAYSGSAGRRRRRRGQSRLVSLPIGPPSYRRGASSSPAIVLGLSGVLSDSVSLLRTASDHVTSHGRTYGLHRMHPTTSASLSSTSSSSSSGGARSAIPGAGATSPDVARRAALALGEECQLRSFGGGIRPYGASVLVCGVEGNECCVSVTDAGGGVSTKRLAFGVGGVSPTRAESAVVVGGTAGMRSELKRALGARLPGQRRVLNNGDGTIESSKSSGGPLRLAVEAAALALLDCQNRQQGSAPASSPSHASSPSATSELDESAIEDAAAHLEVVIVAGGGSRRLSEGHIRRILREALLPRSEEEAEVS